MPRLLTKRGCWITLAAAPFSFFLQRGEQINSGLYRCMKQSRTSGRGAGWYAAMALRRCDGIWRYPVTIEDVSPRYLEG